MTYGSKLLAAAMTTLIAGCAGGELRKAELLGPTGSAFEQGLYAGYLERSSSEYGEGDYRQSDVFAGKAIDAGAGKAVPPTVVSARALPSDKADMLSSARERLMSALAAGAAEKAPENAARAQVMFDCWVEEQTEHRQPWDIEAYKSGFFAALNLANEGVAQASVTKSEIFVLYFNTDSSRLNDAAKAVLREAQAAASKLDGPKVTVAGFADTVGSEKHNLALSDRRAAAVTEALAGAAKIIESLGFGQLKLAVPTGDGVDEPRNRRATIMVSP